MRLDPRKRPTCEELMAHDYFNDFRDWFEDEIQTLIEYDTQEANSNVRGNFSSFQRVNINVLNHQLSKQSIGYPIAEVEE